MPLHLLVDAIDRGDHAAARQLLESNPDLANASLAPEHAPHGARDHSVLHHAVFRGQLPLVELLLDASADIERKNAGGRTALHDSIEFGHRAITDLLLKRGAKLDVCSAAILNRVRELEQIVEADPVLVDDMRTELSPLCWAASGNATETARLLLARGADPNAQTADGKTALELATDASQQEAEHPPARLGERRQFDKFIALLSERQARG